MSSAPGIKIRKIAIGADHAGFELKEKLKKYLAEQGHQVFDCGTFRPDSVDYPKIAYQVAQLVSRGEYELGIMVDGAGIGSAMAANKVPGIRAALCYDLSTARNSREHNNANVLTLGAGLIGFELAKQIVDTWLASECTVDRYLRRVQMIHDIEQGKLSVSHVATPTADPPGIAVSEEDIKKIVSRVQALLQQPSGIPAGCQNATCQSCGQCADKAPAAVRQIISMGATRISNAPGGVGAPQDIARLIDHTLLKPDATAAEIQRVCQEAVEYHFAAVCINPCYVKLAYELTRGSGVKVCSVVGFPLGASVSEIKALEARRAIRDGAKEIDMVINIGALKGGNDELVFRDIRAVVDACVDGSAICKVIIEAALLTDEEKVRACELAKRARAHFVKTSTGFGPGGATAHDVALMRQVVSGTGMGVKAAGGIRSLADAQKMIEAGATRIGASAGVKIVQQASKISER